MVSSLFKVFKLSISLSKRRNSLLNLKLFSNFLVENKVINELNILIERRSLLKTEEIIQKFQNILENKKYVIKLPLNYFQNSIDVCANRGDIQSAIIILQYAGH